MQSRGLALLFVALTFVILAISGAPLFTLLERLVGNVQLFSLLLEPSNLRAVGSTIKVGVLSLGLALVIALPLAWVLARTDLPGRGLFRRVLLFPYFVPPFFFAIAWIVLALPDIGLLNRMVGFNWLSIYSLPGFVWVLATAYQPILLGSLTSAMETMDPSLEEAARVCGASPARTFTRVTLPCLLPSIGSASLLFSLTVLSAFGIAALIGNPAREFVLTTKIYAYAKMGGLSGTNRAFVLSLWLFLMTVALILFNDFIRRRAQYRLTSGKAARFSVVALGKSRTLVLAIVTALSLVLVALPIAALFLTSFLRVAGTMKLSNLTLGNYRYLFKMPEFSRALTNSTWLAIATAAICVVLSFLIAYFKDRTKFPLRNGMSRAASFPFAVPGTILALALIVSYGIGWGIPEIALLGSVWLLLLAYVTKYLALGVESLTPALSNIDPSLDEAARVFGATPGKVMRRILVPILLPMLANVFILTALPVLSELTMSVLLAGAGTETLGTLLFQLQEYANPLAACSLAAMLVTFLFIIMLVLGKLSERFEGNG